MALVNLVYVMGRRGVAMSIQEPGNRQLGGGSWVFCCEKEHQNKNRQKDLKEGEGWKIKERKAQMKKK